MASSSASVVHTLQPRSNAANQEIATLPPYWAHLSPPPSGASIDILMLPNALQGKATRAISSLFDFSKLANRTAEASPVDLAWLQDFDVPEIQSVKQFVEMRPFLKSVVTEAKAEIAKWFSNYSLSLVVCSDEEDEAHRELTLRIEAALSASDASARLDQLRLSWLIDLPDDVQDSFFVTVKRLPA